MSLDISRMSPKVRDVFMFSEPAVLAWDTRAHAILDDLVSNNRRLSQDGELKKIRSEKNTAFIMAALINSFPAWLLYYSIRHNKHFDLGGLYVGLGFVVITSTVIAIHRIKKINAIKRNGAEWRSKINKLIELTEALTTDERKELYAAMYTVGLDINQSNRVAATSYNTGYWDGFIIGGN